MKDVNKHLSPLEAGLYCPPGVEATKTMTTMSYSNDCCTLEQSKELKKLGVKQDSMFYWQDKSLYWNCDQSLRPNVEYEHNGIGCSDCGADCSKCDDSIKHVHRRYSAFNTGELIAMFHESNCPMYTVDADGIAMALLTDLKEGRLTVAEVNRRLEEFHKGK